MTVMTFLISWSRRKCGAAGSSRTAPRRRASTFSMTIARSSQPAIPSLRHVTQTQPGVGDGYARRPVAILMPRQISSTTSS